VAAVVSRLPGGSKDLLGIGTISDRWLMRRLEKPTKPAEKTAATSVGKLLPPDVIKGLPALLTYKMLTGPYAQKGRERHRRVMQAVREGWPAGWAME
jgi:hypothetical protein